MNICITGGLGVIGSWVTRQIISRGLRPLVLSRGANFSLLPDCVGSFDHVACDILDADRVRAIFKEKAITRVIHGAAITMDLSEKNPIEAVRVNDVGTAIVFDAAVQQGVDRVVFVSSGSIYDQWRGQQQGRITINEDYPIRPVHISRITKVCAEEIGRYYSRRYGIEFVSIRSSTMYGPGKLHHHGSVAIHSLLIENAAKGISSDVPQGGEQEDDIVYASDIAQGIVSACFAKQLRHDAYNIASGEPITLRQFADAVLTVIPEAKIRIGPGKDYLGTGLVTNRVFDISRAREDLDYTPKFKPVAAVKNYREMLRLFGHI